MDPAITWERRAGAGPHEAGSNGPHPPAIEEDEEEERHEFRETDARDHLDGLEGATVRMFFERAPSLRLDKRSASRWIKALVERGAAASNQSAESE